MQRFRSMSLARAALALVVTVGCGEAVLEPDTGMDPDTGPPPDASPSLDAGLSLDAGPGLDAGPSLDGGPDAGELPPDAGPPTCATLDCDDGIACTLDTCESAMCLHEVDHAACGTESYCDAVLGCVGGEACAGDDDCPPSPGGCFALPHCVPDTRTCTYPVLDGDMDGYGPPICGGADCNDSNAAIHPGAPDDCDGVDDDCDGAADAPLATSACRSDQICSGGACGCAPGTLACSGVCRDTAVDEMNCGACSRRCAPNETCVASACTCAAPYADCGFGACVLRDTDENHCGVCGLRCIPGAECVGGTCRCPAGQTQCSFGCALLGTNDNCMGCGNACGAGSTCTATGCSPRFPWLTAYGTHEDDFPAADSQALALASDGSVIHAGNYLDPLYESTGGTTPVVTAGNIVVSKHDANGVRQWMHRWFRSPSTASVSVIDAGVGTDGNIYVLLSLRNSLVLHDARTINAGSSSQTLLIALDPSGTYRWHVTSGVSVGGTTTHDLDVTGSEITILGESSTTIDFGGGPLTNSGTPGFVAVLGTTGAHVSSFRLPVAPRLLARRGGSLWVAGTFSGTITLGGIPLTSGGGTDIFVAELTTTGAITSAFRFGLSSPDTISALAVLSGGDLVLSTSAAALLRTDRAGSIVWYETAPEPFDAIAVDATDRIYASRRQFPTPMFVRRSPQGAAQLDVPINGKSVEVAVNGTRAVVGGTWEAALDVGGFRLRSTWPSPAGIWMSSLEAP